MQQTRAKRSSTQSNFISGGYHFYQKCRIERKTQYFVFYIRFRSFSVSFWGVCVSRESVCLITAIEVYQTGFFWLRFECNSFLNKPKVIRKEQKICMHNCKTNRFIRKSTILIIDRFIVYAVYIWIERLMTKLHGEDTVIFLVH